MPEVMSSYGADLLVREGWEREQASESQPTLSELAQGICKHPSSVPHAALGGRCGYFIVYE